MHTHLLLYADRAVRRTLPALGLGRTVLATDDPTPEDAAAYDEVVALPPVSDVAATLAVLEGIRADHVFYQTEFGLLPGSLLAARRGLPGPTPAAAHAVVDKARSRALLAAAGVPVPRHGLAATAADVRGLDLGYPLVLKPLASTLGRGVTKVERDADLDGAVDALRRFLPHAPDVGRLTSFAALAGVPLAADPRRTFLAEAFATGPALEADGLVFGATPRSFGVLEQRVLDRSGFPMEAYLLPADEPGRAAASALAAVAASGLADTGFAVELRGDVVIEVNGRLGEDDGFPDLFRAALGALPMERWFRGDARPVALRGAHALAYVNQYTGGRLRVRGPVPPGVHLTVPDGTDLAPPGTPAFRPHVAWALAAHPTSSRAALAAARARLAALDVDVAGARLAPGGGP